MMTINGQSTEVVASETTNVTETPPPGTPALKSFQMPSAEQVTWFEQNVAALNRQAQAMEAHTVQMQQLRAALLAPMTTEKPTTADIVRGLVTAMAPVTTLTEVQVVARAREIARIYRQYYPAVSV